MGPQIVTVQNLDKQQEQSKVCTAAFNKYTVGKSYWYAHVLQCHNNFMPLGVLCNTCTYELSFVHRIHDCASFCVL